MFSLPRLPIDEKDEDHNASAIALKAPFPKTASSRQDAIGSTDDDIFPPVSTSKIGRRQWNEQIDDPWQYNAWDNVTWDEEQQKYADDLVAKQLASPVSIELQAKFNSAPADYWDTFYLSRKDTFFKDRAWLRNEFPSLADAVKPNSGPVRIAEIGCGPGNTTYPILAANENPELMIYSLDYSKKAIEVFKENPAYDPSHCTGIVWDMSSSELPVSILPGSLDIAIMIFCFSALHPNEWAQAVRNVYTMLKPGGRVLFRDYARYDLTQLRMKGSRYMQDNLYIRGDGTRVYFFHKGSLPQNTQTNETEKFALIRMTLDRRLLLNRARKLKMYRMWLQVCTITIFDAQHL
ncbi:S-adenosyl-L-methionine-dependent methyltransferase [Melampsora americana]|nr:S-adenosyl-L-methionine-dependent methyltransferase [Melampsora americana]